MGEPRVEMQPCLIDISNGKEAFDKMQSKPRSMEYRAGGMEAAHCLPLQFNPCAPVSLLAEHPSKRLLAKCHPLRQPVLTR
jgi:hypothetical protein